MRVRALGHPALRTPVVRTSLALIVNTGLNAALGFAYWVAAARLLPSEIVGAGAAGVSSLLFVSSLGWAGMQFVLLRYVPAAGPATRRLVIGAYAVAVLVALVLGVAFLVVAGRQEDLAYIGGGPVAALGFLAAVAVWVVFSLQDAVLVGIGKAAWVPAENLVFGVVKLVVLVALTSLASPWSLIVSWVGSALPLVIVINALIWGRAAAHQPSSLPSGRRVGRFWMEQHAISLMVAAPDSLVPLLVIAVLGPAANAHYYAAWTVSFSLRLLVVNIGSAMTAESSRHGADRAATARHATLLAAALTVPVVIGTVLMAPIVMSIYGDEYASATDALRLFGLGLAPFAVVNLFIARRRVTEQGGQALLVATISLVATLAVDVWAIPALGISGAAAGWLVGWSLAAISVGALALMGPSGVVRRITG